MTGEQQPPRRREPIVPIAHSASPIEAEMWVEALRRDGIPAMIKSLTYGAIPSDPTGFYILVLEGDAEPALRVLEDLGIQPEQRLR